MGKSRSKSHKQPRNNPTGLIVDNSEQEEISSLVTMKTNGGTALTPESIKALTKQLQSASVEDRDCACNALACLIRNGDDSNIALHEGLIKILGPLLLDTSSSVCHSAASALHTIITTGGDPAIKLATDHDILTPLVALLKRVPSQWKPHKAPGDKIDTSTATFIETVGTLTLLSESSSLAVDRMHKEGIVSSMIGYIDEEVYGSDVVSSVAQFLSTCTEDQGNVDYAESLKKQILTKIINKEGSDALLKTLAALILLNLNQQSLDSELGITVQGVVDILATSLCLDHRKAASLVVDYLPINQVEEEDDSMNSESRVGKLQDALESTERLLSALIKALEILTNLCYPGDVDSSDSDEFYQDESCSEGSIDGIEESPLELNPDLKVAFLQAKLFQSVVDKARMPAENIIEALSHHPSGKMLLKRYETLQSRAFLCLSNMVTALDVEEMGGSKGLFDIWCGLALISFQGENNQSDQTLEAATTSMRAIIHKLALHQEDIVQLLKLEDVASLCQRTEQCLQAQSKVNLLQVLGILGSMAAGTEPPLTEPRGDIVRGIGKLLLDTVCQEPQLWIVAEALDALFDVFKEDHVDGVAIDIQLVERLRTLASGFKHRVHSQRRSLPADHLPVVMTAKDNLLRFIKYKTKQRSSAASR